ncbi:hypothetical protein D8M33_09770 [Micrococcus sp. HSID17245]|nr:hypothetical protein D8M33_09770 [Micrococcus sp. HSID17245]
MTARPVLHLQEARTTGTDDLSRAEARWLMEQRIAEVVPGARRQWDVHVGNVAGVVSRRDLVVEIEPKIPVAQVLWMVQEAGMAPKWGPTDTPLAKDLSLTEAVLELYLRSVERLVLRSGLRRSYIGVDDSSWTLRGRVRTADQLTRHQGRPLPLEVHFDDYTLDTEPNRILAAALDAVRPLAAHRRGGGARGHRFVLRAQALLNRFDGVSLTTPGLRPHRDGGGRLHESYTGPLMLAHLVLNGAGLASEAGDRRAEGFLLPMPQVFERCVGEILRGRHGARLNTQATLGYASEKGSPTRRVRPDLVVFDGEGQPAVVMDTKYKRADPTAADLYQMHVYARMFGVQDVVLLYAEHTRPRTLLLEGSRPESETAIRLHLRGIDLTMPPEQIRQQVLAASQLT